MIKAHMRNGIVKTGKRLYVSGVICLVLFSAAVRAQQLQTFTDRNSILIGEQVQLKVRASFPQQAFRVSWFSIPDSIPHFDIIQKGPVDSSSENGNSVLQQSITLTSFDSGRWNIPAFPVQFDPANDDTTIRLFTDSVAIAVSYSPADTSKQLRDIKPIISVTLTDYTWYYIAGGIVLLLLMLFFTYRYWKKNRGEKPAKPASKLTAYEEAMRALEQLAKQDLSDPASVKTYHSLLAAVFKQYLGRKQERNLLTKTTSDLLVRVSEQGMPAEHVSGLATALRCTDAVKFAKYLPVVTESQDCLQKIKAAIELTERQTVNTKS